MELIKVVNAKQTLESLSGMEGISSHLVYWMTKFVIKAQSEYDFFVAGMQKLINKYAEKDENGQIIYSEDQNITIKKEFIDSFNKESAELQKTDVEAPNIRFALSEFSQELKLSMKQMMALMDFIDEER